MTLCKKQMTGRAFPVVWSLKGNLGVGGWGAETGTGKGKGMPSRGGTP